MARVAGQQDARRLAGEPGRASSVAGVSSVATKSQPTDARQPGEQPRHGRTGRHGGQQPGDQRRRRSGPTSAHSSSQASPSPGWSSSSQPGRHVAVAVQQRPAAVGERVAEDRRRVDPAQAVVLQPERPDRRRRGGQRVERAERVVDESGVHVLVAVHGTTDPGWASSTSTDQPRSARWLAATRPLGPGADHHRVVVTSRALGAARAARSGSVLRQCSGRVLDDPGLEAPGRKGCSSIVTSVSVPPAVAAGGSPRRLLRATRGLAAGAWSPGSRSRTSVVSSTSAGQTAGRVVQPGPRLRPGPVHLAHPGRADHPQRVEPAIGEHLPGLVGLASTVRVLTLMATVTRWLVRENGGAASQHAPVTGLLSDHPAAQALVDSDHVEVVVGGRSRSRSPPPRGAARPATGSCRTSSAARAGGHDVPAPRWCPPGRPRTARTHRRTAGSCQPSLRRDVPREYPVRRLPALRHPLVVDTDPVGVPHRRLRSPRRRARR